MRRQSEPDQPPALSGDDARRRRLAFRASHRGTHENDLLIGGYVARHLATFDDAALEAIEAILELPDVELADWLTGRRPIPPEHDRVPLGALLRAMRDEAAAGAAR